MDILDTVKKLKALDNEIKLEILSYLVNHGAKSITDISKELKLNFSTTHKYLEQLENAGLVKSRQELKSRLKRVFYINDFEIQLSPQTLSRYQTKTVQTKKPQYEFKVVTLTGRIERFDRTRFTKQFLELGLPQNIIDLILDSTLPNAYDYITTLELRRRFIQELKSRANSLGEVISELRDIRLGKTNYLNFISDIHPEALQQHINGEIFIENLGKPKLMNFTHDLRGISVHGITGKKPRNLSELLEQTLTAVKLVLNFSRPIQSFDSFNYFIAPCTEKLDEVDIEKEIIGFLKKLNSLEIKTFLNIEVGEPDFAKELPTDYFTRKKENIYSKYNKEAERVARIICNVVKPIKNVHINLKIWQYDKYLSKLVRSGIFIANMNPEWQKSNASYIYESRFDSKWKGWFRTVRTGIAQNISINVPLIAKQTRNKVEFKSKLESVLTKAIDYNVHMSNLFLNTSLGGATTSVKSVIRSRWTYIPFEDGAYSISLANINEAALISKSKLADFREFILSACNEIIEKTTKKMLIRLVLKEEYNPVILKRFEEVNKLNNILYPKTKSFTTKELIDSAYHEKLKGGHLLKIKYKDFSLSNFLESNLGLVRLV